MTKKVHSNQKLISCQFVLLLTASSLDCHPLPGGTETRRLKLLNTPVPYGAIAQACQASYGPGWKAAKPAVGLSIQQQHDDLVQFMKTVQQNTAWFPVQTIRFDSWQYADGNKYEGEVSGSLFCGSLNVKFGSIEGRDCSAGRRGYVCQIEDCEHCPPYLSPYSCLRINSKCFLLGCDAGSWYDARNRCYDFNMELAEVRSPDEAFLLADAIKRVPTRKCQHYWLGLRKEDSVLDKQG